MALWLSFPVGCWENGQRTSVTPIRRRTWRRWTSGTEWAPIRCLPPRLIWALQRCSTAPQMGSQPGAHPSCQFSHWKVEDSGEESGGSHRAVWPFTSHLISPDAWRNIPELGWWIRKSWHIWAGLLGLAECSLHRGKDRVSEEKKSTKLEPKDQKCVQLLYYLASNYTFPFMPSSLGTKTHSTVRQLQQIQLHRQGTMCVPMCWTVFRAVGTKINKENSVPFRRPWLSKGSGSINK